MCKYEVIIDICSSEDSLNCEMFELTRSSEDSSSVDV